MRGWLRRNRVALVILPVAVVLAASGNSSRLRDQWFDRGLHERQQPGTDGVVHYVEHYDDRHLRYDITPAIRLLSLERTATVTSEEGETVPATLPDRAALWKVVLHWDVAPDVVMGVCHVGLAASDGRFWAPGYSRQFTADVSQPLSPCVPSATPGPGAAIDQAVIQQPTDSGPRPAAYDTTVYVLTAGDAKPSEVRVWWFMPGYAALPVTS